MTGLHHTDFPPPEETDPPTCSQARNARIAVACGLAAFWILFAGLLAMAWGR